MINIIVCDDNTKDRTKIEYVVKKFMENNKIEHKIYSYDDYGKSFYSKMNENLPFKIYLLDIEAPSKSGIDVARDIRRKDIDSVIIFLTSHEELGDIVLKNDLMFLSFINKFDDCENRLINSLKKSIDILSNKQVIRFTDKNILYTIKLNDILYVTTESFERKTIIKTDYAEFKVRKPLSDIVELALDHFTQTHRACYINLDRVVRIDKTNKIVYFDTGDTIDLVSDKYKKEFD